VGETPPTPGTRLGAGRVTRLHLDFPEDSRLQAVTCEWILLRPLLAFCLSVCLSIYLSRAIAAAYGVSQARGQIVAAALAYTTATEIQDPGHVCDLHHSSRQCQILNPLSKARD